YYLRDFGESSYKCFGNLGLNAAENFGRGILYEESFDAVRKAATLALEFHPKRKEFFFLTVAIQMFCNNMKDKLSDTNRPRSNNFYALAQNLTPWFCNAVS
ncbi:MAG TPA: hypothetical protein PLY23_09380, partial [Alphaproteobacteria bacterium]|nr:hypothetical protein [Alphaproteobacteria bacterium]HQS94865.1 hypothetical protein [Alphaproteobacteria bacterium]